MAYALAFAAFFVAFLVPASRGGGRSREAIERRFRNEQREGLGVLVALAMVAVWAAWRWW
jgi:hypothetical protein